MSPKQAAGIERIRHYLHRGAEIAVDESPRAWVRRSKGLATRIRSTISKSQPVVSHAPPTDPVDGGTDYTATEFLARKAKKLERIEKSAIRRSSVVTRTESFLDCLTDELRSVGAVVDTENVSSWDYDGPIMDVVNRHEDGLVLDCGAGYRRKYFDHVVNLEIAAYPSTDVLGIAEALPFEDDTFDAVICLAVLEHVRNPMIAATEIARVLKPGGELFCTVPFLQPLHGYPHHFYNMTHLGLSNLFSEVLTIDRQEVLPGGHPIFALNWIVQRWFTELPPGAAAEFGSTRIKDLLANPVAMLDWPICTQLPEAAQYELACMTALWATKPHANT